MKKIPTRKENPTGLHGRYEIRKVVPHPKAGQPKPGNLGAFFTDPGVYPDYTTVPVDSEAEYFVLRLDENGGDLNHIKACRIGIHAYADAIEPFIPQLAKDIRERYPLL